MEVITILKDETNNRRLMQINLDELAKGEELLEDIYDIIAIEVRKNEETISWEDVKDQLRDEGKLSEMYSIRFKKSAQKELSQISPPYNLKIVQAIDGLSEDPRPPGVKKLKGERKCLANQGC